MPIDVFFKAYRKRKPTDDLEAAVQGVLGDRSVNVKALAARSAEVDTEANVGNYVAARLGCCRRKYNVKPFMKFIMFSTKPK